jgi:PAS domain S-box-containing protein
MSETRSAGISGTVSARLPARDAEPTREDQAQALLESILDASADAIVGKALDGTIVAWNPAAETLYGYSAAEAVGRPDSVLTPPGRSGEAARVMDSVKRGESVARFETVRIRKDGVPIHVSLAVAPVRTNTGVITGAVMVARELGVRKRAAAFRLETEAKFRLLFQANPLPMWVRDCETLRFLDVNHAAVARYGYSRQEFLQLCITDIHPLEDVPLLLRNLARKRERLEHYGPSRHRFKDGRVVEVEIASHLLGWNGRSACLVVAQDISDRKRAAESLRESEERFRTAVKPIRQSHLLQAIVTAWARRRGAAGVPEVSSAPAEAHRGAPRPVAEAPAGPAIRILIAEDNAVNRRVAVRMVEKLGLRADLAADGREAVRLFEMLPYDLILMDCQMPNMDGYAAAREIRRREPPGTHSLIIAMTAEAMAGSRERCLEAGMDDYITKPVSLDNLSAILDWWLHGNDPSPRP